MTLESKIKSAKKIATLSLAIACGYIAADGLIDLNKSSDKCAEYTKNNDVKYYSPPIDELTTRFFRYGDFPNYAYNWSATRSDLSSYVLSHEDTREYGVEMSHLYKSLFSTPFAILFTTIFVSQIYLECKKRKEKI